MGLPKIDVPIYEMTLISTDKTIKFRPFLVKEQKLLMMALESNEIKDYLNTVKQIAKNCVLTDLNIDDLPIFDLESIFLNLRARSINEVVNLQYKCNNIVKEESGEDKICGSLEKFEVNLLDIKPIVNDKYDKKIMFSEKMGMIMKYPTFEIISNIKSTTEEEIVLELLSKCIDYVFDEDSIYYAKDYTEKELQEFIENLQQKDLEKIQLFFDTSPKIKHSLNFNCKKCGYKEDIGIEGLQNFFV
jgi:hypothetical protein